MAETTPTRPDGFSYHPGFISEAEEHEILQDVDALNFSEVRMHGVVAKRGVLHFGLIYGYQTWTLLPGPPLPEFLHPLRDTLEPRSVYVLSGSPRFQWQHSIPTTKDCRYSITFRTLRNGSPSPPDRLSQAVAVTQRP